MRNPTYADAVEALGRTSDGICSHGSFVSRLWDVPEETLNVDVETYRKTHDAEGNLLPNVNYTEPGLMGGLNVEERSMVAQDHILDAIKSVRNRYGIGLKEAKDLVDNFIMRYSETNPARAESIRRWRSL